MGLPVDTEEYQTEGVIRWRRSDRGVALLILCHLALGSISLICVARIYPRLPHYLRQREATRGDCHGRSVRRLVRSRPVQLRLFCRLLPFCHDRRLSLAEQLHRARVQPSPERPLGGGLRRGIPVAGTLPTNHAAIADIIPTDFRASVGLHHSDRDRRHRRGILQLQAGLAWRDLQVSRRRT